MSIKDVLPKKYKRPENSKLGAELAIVMLDLIMYQKERDMLTRKAIQQAYVQCLFDNGKIYHFDDDPKDIITRIGNGVYEYTFSKDECRMIRYITSVLYDEYLFTLALQYEDGTIDQPIVFEDCMTITESTTTMRDVICLINQEISK